MNLKHLTDNTLLLDTRHLVSEERRISAKLIHHLKEIEVRRLFSDLGYSSLFDFMIKDLKYTEASASRRIQAARMLKTIPEIESKIESGALNFTNVAMAAQLFKNEEITSIPKQRMILKEIEGKTRLESEKILNKHLKIPKSLERQQINISLETWNKIQNLTGLTQFQNLEQVLNYALDLAIIKKEQQRFRKSSNLISGMVKRKVYERDKACTKCGSHFRLEYDHILPYAMGGKSSVGNLRILCRSCNQRHRITQRLHK